MAKSQDEVEKQLSNMISFIHAEAKEKAKEINVRAEEEFNIEKTSLVQEGKKRVNEEFEQKFKQIDVQRKITYSNQLNQCRLAVLKSRDQSIQNILLEAQGRLTALSSDQQAYKTLLKQLILQALMKLREDKVTVVCRAEDDELVTAAIPDAVNEYRERTGVSATLVVEKRHRLAPGPGKGKGPTCAGGVVLAAKEGKILCNNTLEQRLSLASEGLLPEIRGILFPPAAGGIDLNKF